MKRPTATAFDNNTAVGVLGFAGGMLVVGNVNGSFVGSLLSALMMFGIAMFFRALSAKQRRGDEARQLERDIARDNDLNPAAPASAAAAKPTKSGAGGALSRGEQIKNRISKKNAASAPGIPIPKPATAAPPQTDADIRALASTRARAAAAEAQRKLDDQSSAAQQQNKNILSAMCFGIAIGTVVSATVRLAYGMVDASHNPTDEQTASTFQPRN